jgi:hypothetical protein
MRAAVAAAGSLALLGGVVAVSAMPASADDYTNGAYGASATGPLTLAPVAQAEPGSSPRLASNANLGNLLTTGLIKTTATTMSATAKIAGVVVNLSDLSKLTASNVTSACYRDFLGNVVGDTDISSGRIVTIGQTTIALPSEPAPNTVISVPGIATITLNQQSSVAGQLTVNAIYIALGNTRQALTRAMRQQTLTIGNSSCAVPVG